MIFTAVVQVVAVLGGLPFSATGLAVAVVITSLLIAVPSISSGRPIGIGAALVIRAVRQQLIRAINTAAGGWWLQTLALTHCSNFVRIFLLTGFCISI
jgi:polysaccharide transporter, PST family